MKKKILSLLLVVITSAGSAFANFDYSYYVTVDKKHYYLDTENHTAELSDSGNWNAESLTIPSTISYNDIDTWASISNLDLSNYMEKGVDYVTAGKLSGSTIGTRATAEGYNNTASGQYSHAEGYYTTAQRKS